MIQLAILASGRGSNLKVIIEACQSGRVQAEITGVIINVADAPAIAIARAAGLRTVVIPHRDFYKPDRSPAASREAFDQAVAQQLQPWQPDLIVLAGFMRILSAAFVQRFSGQMINIHPSLLPAYRGQHTHQRVLQTGDRYHGCSVHFVTPELDAGAVIAQSVLPVLPGDDQASLAHRVQQLEHQLYPRIINWIATGRVALLGDVVYLDGYPLQTPVRFWQQG